MSAINPASFATPTAGLHPPGQTPMGYGQDAQGDRRRAHDYKGFGVGANQGLSPGVLADQNQTNRETMAGPGGGGRGSYVDPYQAFNVGGAPDPNLSGFPSGMQPQTDPFSTYPSVNYGSLDPNAPEYGPTGQAGSGDARRAGLTQNDWVNNFQGLSLGS